MRLIFKLLAVLFCLWTVQVNAHTSLKSSNIESGGVYETLPESLQISFGAKVGLAKIELKTKSGQQITLDYTAPKSMEKTFVIPLPQLAPNDYIVQWRTISGDGHAMKGQLSFTRK